MHPLEQTVRQACSRGALLKPGGRILVGVSGGADSMALLHILAALRGAFSVTLIAAYIDHGLRPDETPGEWTCVQEAASSLGIESVCKSVDVSAWAAAKKLSLEHAARELRYQAFSDCSRAWATDLLAVAHTADDQVEEVLLRLFRGGGRKALSGMARQSGGIIRPLLAVRKAELLAYLAEKKIPFCHDSSNDDLRFLRNRIRHDLLPLLEDRYDIGIRQALLKTAANLQEDEDLLEHLLAQSWDQAVAMQAPTSAGQVVCVLKRDPFRRLHSALQRRMVEQLLWRIGDAAGHEHIVAVVAAARSGRNGSELHLSRGLRVAIGREQLEFSYPRGRGPWRGRLHTS